MIGYLKFFSAFALGAAAAYYLDPDRGKGRRARTKDQIAARLRSSVDELETLGTRAADRAQGLAHEAVPREAFRDYNEPTLAHKVESEVFADPRFHRGKINVSAENSTVVLKGKIETPELAAELVEAVREVPGVEQVDNRLNYVGTTT